MERRRSFPLLFVLLTGAILRANCPTPPVSNGQTWGVRSVNFSFNTAYTSPGYYLTALPWNFLPAEQADVRAAFATWTAANQSQNFSGVNFYEAGSNGPYRVYAYQANFPGVPFQDPGKAAFTYVALYGGTTQIAFVSTELYFGSVRPGRWISDLRPKCPKLPFVRYKDNAPRNWTYDAFDRPARNCGSAVLRSDEW